jgi:hypothetical protein
VAELANHRLGVSLFSLEDGSFLRHVRVEDHIPLHQLCDVQEFGGGWLVLASWGSHVAASVAHGAGDVHALPCPGPYSGLVGSSEVGEGDARDGELTSPSALALVPSLGLVVRELGSGGRVRFFGTPDAIAMASMSCCRVGWFAAVARGTLRR